MAWGSKAERQQLKTVVDIGIMTKSCPLVLMKTERKRNTEKKKIQDEDNWQLLWGSEAMGNTQEGH